MLTVAGFTFYNPSVSTRSTVITDDTGTVIGITETVTITDTVVAPSNVAQSSLTGIVRSALDALKQNDFIAVTIDNQNTNAKITNVTVNDATDYVTRLIYSVELEVVSKKVLPTNPFGLDAGDNVQTLVISEELDVATDRTSFIIKEQTYYNKATEFVVNIDVTCDSTAEKSAIKNAKKVLSNILITTAEKLSDLVDQETAYLQSIETNSSSEGSISAVVKVLYLPKDSAVAATLDERIVQNFNRSPMKYQTRDYNIVVTSIESATYNDSDLVSLPDRAESAKNIAHGILQSLSGTDHRTITTLTENQIVTQDPCPPSADGPPLPDLPDNACYNTREVSSSENRSEGSCTITLKQSTEPFNCDLDGTKIEYTININENQKVYAEMHGWSNAKSVVQDFGTTKADTIDFQINVSDLSKCGTGAGLVDKAKAKLEELKTGYSGEIIAEKISLTDNRCSLSATFHIGVDSSNEDTDNQNFAGGPVDIGDRWKIIDNVGP